MYTLESGAVKKEEKPLAYVALILHDIRSVLNVGAIFRTAEALGVGEVIISGYTPGPLDRFGRVRSDFHKAALGAEDSLVWRRFENVEDVLQFIKNENRELLVLEQDVQAIDIRELKPSDLGDKQLALVVGNEVEGVDAAFLEAAGTILEIPMFGKKESFNVASAAAIALYALLAQ